MKLKLIILMLTLSSVVFSQETEKIWPQTTMVNDVIFKDSSFTQLNIGCGFLLKYNNEIFAITAKHIINVAKSDAMKTTNFEGTLKEWRMYPRDKKEQTVIMGELLNTDATDSLNWNYFRNAKDYHDFLIFKVKENNSEIIPLELSTKKPKKGDILYNIGWSYKDEQGPQRIYKYSFLNFRGLSFDMRGIIVPENPSGTSGSPVINSDGFLVGVISTSYTDPITKELYCSPQYSGYLNTFFENYFKN